MRSGSFFFAPVLDEPLANQYFEILADLEHVVANRCL
jgi:hypothetical protein